MASSAISTGETSWKKEVLSAMSGIQADVSSCHFSSIPWPGIVFGCGFLCQEDKMVRLKPKWGILTLQAQKCISHLLSGL